MASAPPAMITPATASLAALAGDVARCRSAMNPGCPLWWRLRGLLLGAAGKHRIRLASKASAFRRAASPRSRALKEVPRPANCGFLRIPDEPIGIRRYTYRTSTTETSPSETASPTGMGADDGPTRKPGTSKGSHPASAKPTKTKTPAQVSPVADTKHDATAPLPRRTMRQLMPSVGAPTWSPSGRQAPRRCRTPRHSHCRAPRRVRSQRLSQRQSRRRPW
jgi:hypothetical protein